jgi:hypothetical protein
MVREAIFLRIVRPGADNAEALAWLERALGHARDRGQERLENLLEIVRADVIFEIRFTIGALDGKPPNDGEISGV